jgi:uncharacterized protein YdaU (DUF1376 family)
MAFYPGDYLADTMHLTCEEHGAYLLLLMCMWRRGGSVPDDNDDLARMVRLDMPRWLAVKRRLLPLLTIEGGYITQKRLQEEIAKAKERSESGRKSANARWNKNKDINDANALRKQCIAYGSDSTSSEVVTQKEEVISNSSQLMSEFANEFWPTFPNKTAKPYALKCFMRARKRASLETIMEGLDRYIATKPPDRPWLNPSTFLNQDRWGDQAAPVVEKLSAFQQAVKKHIEEVDSRHERNSEIGTGRRTLRGASSGGDLVEFHAEAAGLHSHARPSDQGLGWPAALHCKGDG